tara:strand:- start:2570 stop:2893 length:324 start_codon:yes stop_codon:yes gene_type:complete
MDWFMYIHMSWLLPCGPWVHLGEYKGVNVSWGDVSTGSYSFPDQVVVQWTKEWFDRFVRDEMLDKYPELDEYVIYMAWISSGVKERVKDWDEKIWSDKVHEMFKVDK